MRNLLDTSYRVIQAKQAVKGMQKITMEVGWMARSLMQDGCVLPVAAQSPQYRPAPQSRADEHDSPTCKQDQAPVNSGCKKHR